MRMVKGSLLADAMLGLSIAALIGWYTAALTSWYVQANLYLEHQDIDWGRKNSEGLKYESTRFYER